MTEGALPHVVIVGGGFGGLAAARALRKAPVRITLFDRSNHYLFQPLLYQVATATLSPGDIAAPIRELVSKQRNVTVAMAEVTGVDSPNRRVLVNYLGRADAPFDYDYLVLATGASHSYFGHDEFAQFAPGLKSISDAESVRTKVLKAFDFWLDLGVDGLRLDAIPYLYEREGTNGENLPETHAFIKQLRAHIDGKYSDRMLLAEANQ